MSVYLSSTGEPVDSFSPARASDFWGICWEKDTYTIWTQSADVGNHCYEYSDGAWVRQDARSVPDYIISRYNKEYRSDAALREHMYRSPTD